MTLRLVSFFFVALICVMVLGFHHVLDSSTQEVQKLSEQVKKKEGWE
jgi:hypothetical protein